MEAWGSLVLAFTQRGNFMKKILFGTLLVLISLGLFVWWNWFTDVPLKINPETSLITSPLTPDGKVDYPTWLLSLYPEGLQTERNAAWRLMKEIDLRDLQQRDNEDSEISDSVWKEMCGLMDQDPDAPRLAYKTPFLKTMEEYFQAKDPDDLTSINDARFYILHSQDFSREDFVAKYEDFIRAWSEENAPALDRIEEILLDPKSEYFFFPFLIPEGNFTPWDIKTPTIPSMYGLGDSLVIRSIWNLSQGNNENAIRSFEAVNRMGTLIQKGSRDIVTYLLGVRMQGAGIFIPFVEAKTPLTTEQWKRLRDLPFFEYSPEEFYHIIKIFDFPVILNGIQYCSNRKITDPYDVILPPPDSKFWYFGYDWNQIAREIRQAQKEVEANFQKDPLHADMDVLSVVKDEPQSKWETIRRFFLSSRKTRSHMFTLILLREFSLNPFREILLAHTTSGHLLRLKCALELYLLDHNNEIPSAFTTDAEGKPLHSWTIQLLPYLGKEAEELYAKIRLDEPWDSEWNAQFHNQMPNVFTSSNELGSHDITSFCWVKECEKFTVFQNSRAKNWMDPSTFMTEKEAEEELQKDKKPATPKNDWKIDF